MLETKIYSLSEAELQSLVTDYLRSKGFAGDIASFSPLGGMAVTFKAVELVAPVAPVVLPPPAPVTPIPGAAPVTPAGALKCIATCFGYNDPGDNGKGAWGADTNNRTTRGVAVPIPILEATCGGTALANVSGWTTNVFCMESGKLAEKVDIVDKGPGDTIDGQHALLIGKDGVLHALDLTYGACTALGVKYDANSASYNVVWWFSGPNGDVMPKGLDGPKKVV